MSMADLLSKFAEAPEAELVKQIEVLIRKMAEGRASESDVQQLQQLQKQRVEMMRPKRRSGIQAA
jgi:hypothetical protein